MLQIYYDFRPNWSTLAGSMVARHVVRIFKLPISSKNFLTTNKSDIMYSYLVACSHYILIVIQGQIGQLGQAQGLLGICI